MLRRGGGIRAPQDGRSRPAREWALCLSFAPSFAKPCARPIWARDPHPPLATPEAPQAPLATPAAETPETIAANAEWLQRNRNIVGAAAAVVLALIVGGLYYFQSYLPEQNAEALDQMSGAQRFFEKDSFNLALQGRGQNPGFEQIIDDYPGTKAANLARLYAGLSYLNLKRYGEAVEALEAYDKGKNMLSATAEGALGKAHEAQGDYAAAAKAYLAAADRVPNAQTSPDWLMQAGRAFELASDTDGALRAYRRIARDYPTSSEGQQVEKYIARLAPDSED